MRYLALALLVVSASGCVGMGQHRSADLEIAEAREAREKRKAQEKLGAGSTIEEVRFAWDSPDYEELRDGKVIFRYENNGDPMAFEFVGGKLTSYYRDEALATKLAREQPKRCVSQVGWFGRTHTVCQ